MGKTTKKITLIFEEELHKKFKIACINEDSSMQFMLIKLVKKYLEESKNNEK